MKKEKFGIVLLSLLISTSALFLNGCTLVGNLIGTIADNSQPILNVTTWEIQTITKGTPVTLYLRQGAYVIGTYNGLSSVGREEYKRAFAENRLTWPSGTTLPGIQDSITVVLKNGTSIACTLDGYNSHFLSATTVASTSPVPFPYLNMTAIERAGNIIPVEELRATLSNLHVPLYSFLRLDTKSGERNVALEDIQQIIMQDKKNYTVICTVIGLTIDIIVAAVLISNVSSPSSTKTSPPPTTGKGSCPFVYSFDGSEYVLDSETFGGSILKSLQRTDYDNLEHLAEVDGTYRLKVANRLEETQYIDELKLLVVDHPKGTQVVPTFSGSLRVLSDLHKPTSARDYANNNVLPLVTSSDNDWWVSNPFGRNSDDKNEVRDGLVLSFSRPENAKSAKLALHVQNTAWATEIEAQLLRLKGKDLGKWYEAVNGSRVYADSFVEGVKREAMLAVNVWDGTSWSCAGYVWFVGPYVSKSQIFELDLKKLPKDELRIRLESTAGLWMVNSVNIDFTPDPTIKITEVTLEKGIDHTGKDVRSFLGAIDDHYYVLEKAGYEADLTFKVPLRVDGLDRSVILKSTGYYTIHVSGQGEPHNDFVTRLGNEPGAFGSYSVWLLNNFAASRISDLTK